MKKHLLISIAFLLSFAMLYDLCPELRVMEVIGMVVSGIGVIVLGAVVLAMGIHDE